VTLSGTGVDPEDGPLAGSALVWTSSLQGVLGTGASLSRNDLVGGVHVITLTVTDSGNAKGTATHSITIMVSAGQPQGGAPTFPGHLPR
jgi:chitinase